jgi:tRNA nucleotidyltransferase (CCA-adding enzyme)
MTKQGYRQVGRDFPVFLHPETNDEYALARVERKTGVGHTAFSVDASADVTLEDDLLRRDLTINAIARDQQGAIVDPYGGCADLDNRVLRHVSDAFAEDPLRVLRVARFTARFHRLGFSIADSTLELMRKIAASGELKHLSPERIWQETEKALETDHPQVFFSTLRECGALAAAYPEIDRLFGVSLEQAARLSAKPIVRFAVLVHDLGKGTTPVEILPRHIGHERRSVELIERLGKRIRIPNRFLALARSVARFHGVAHRIEEVRPAKLLELLTDIGALRDSGVLEDFIAACEADAKGRTGLENEPYPQGDYLRRALARAAAVTADSVANGSLEGKAFGDALKALRVDAIRQEIQRPP